jgi:hypothetical protein
MEWLPWLLTQILGIATATVTAAVSFLGAAGAGAVVALIVARLEARQRRQGVRAAEKRGRLEAQFETARSYAAALHRFVWGASISMQVWSELTSVQDLKLSENYVEQELDKLHEAWSEVLKLEPQPAPRFVIRDNSVMLPLSMLEVIATLAHDKAGKAIQGESITTEEERTRLRDDAARYLTTMLESMEDAVDAVRA